jgi:hypothetical protein
MPKTKPWQVSFLTSIFLSIWIEFSQTPSSGRIFTTALMIFFWFENEWFVD